jgi:hypothetical protein
MIGIPAKAATGPGIQTPKLEIESEDDAGAAHERLGKY